MMNRWILPILGSLTLLLGGCGGPTSDPAGQDQSVSLAGADIGGPFTLTDQDGRKASWSDFRGKYALVYFGYTYCPDVCPVDLQRIAQGYALFAKSAPDRAARIVPLFITLDPRRDTPAVLKNYVSNFPPFIGLTGTEEEIAAVAKRFAVAYSKEAGKGPSDYLVAHSRTPYLFGPDGAPIAIMPVDDPATPAQEGVPADIAAFLDSRVK